MNEEKKSTTEDIEMSIQERSTYLRSIPWVKEHAEELKSIDKGNLFIKFKDYNTEFSLIPIYNNRKNYYVIVHTMNEKVRKFMDDKGYKPDEFKQNYYIEYRTFSSAVSGYISLVRNIRDSVLCVNEENDEKSIEQEDIYSKVGARLTIEEVKDRIDKIHTGNSPVNFSVRRGAIVYATSYKVKYGSPTIRLIPKNIGYDIDVFIDNNLNYLIRNDLIDYVKDTLGLKRTYSGSFGEHCNDSFNVAYNKFRDIATDIIVFILSHRVFKESIKSRKRRPRG